MKKTLIKTGLCLSMLFATAAFTLPQYQQEQMEQWDEQLMTTIFLRNEILRSLSGAQNLNADQLRDIETAKSYYFNPGNKDSLSQFLLAI